MSRIHSGPFAMTHDAYRRTPSPRRRSSTPRLFPASRPLPYDGDTRDGRGITLKNDITGDRDAPPAPRRPTGAPTRVDPNPVLGVFGLSIRTRERDLEDEFMRYGDVDKVVIVYDQRASLIPCSSQTTQFGPEDQEGR
jgi:transformer-2 protein